MLRESLFGGLLLLSWVSAGAHYPDNLCGQRAKEVCAAFIAGTGKERECVQCIKENVGRLDAGPEAEFAFCKLSDVAQICDVSMKGKTMEETPDCEKEINRYCKGKVLEGVACIGCLQEFIEKIDEAQPGNEMCSNFQLQHFCFFKVLPKNPSQMMLKMIEKTGENLVKHRLNSIKADPGLGKYQQERKTKEQKHKSAPKKSTGMNQMAEDVGMVAVNLRKNQKELEKALSHKKVSNVHESLSQVAKNLAKTQLYLAKALAKEEHSKSAKALRDPGAGELALGEFVAQRDSMVIHAAQSDRGVFPPQPGQVDVPALPHHLFILSIMFAGLGIGAVIQSTRKALLAAEEGARIGSERKQRSLVDYDSDEEAALIRVQMQGQQELMQREKGPNTPSQYLV